MIEGKTTYEKKNECEEEEEEEQRIRGRLENVEREKDKRRGRGKFTECGNLGEIKKRRRKGKW